MNFRGLHHHLSQFNLQRSKDVLSTARRHDPGLITINHHRNNDLSQLLVAVGQQK